MAFKDINHLFRTYGGDLIRFLVRRGADRETAADLAQEAFLRMMRAEPAGDFRDACAYLFRTAVNLSVDQGRRERIVPLADNNDDVTGFADPVASPERIVMSRQELVRLGRLIDALPPRCREVFVLARIEGLNTTEIGERLGISPKTAFSHMTRALILLKEKMEEGAP